MRLARFDDNRLGVVTGDQIRDVTTVLAALPPLGYPAPIGDRLVASLDTLRPAIAAAAAAATPRPVTGVRLLTPVANPSKLVAAPVNYARHAAESAADPTIHHHQHLADIERIALFLKATSALAGAGDGVALRHLDRRNDHEIELAVVIGLTADRVTRAAAMDHVAGYTIGLDMTVRGTEDRSFRKSIDTYAVLGPWLVTADEVGDPSALDLTLSVNGVARQMANTRDLVVDIPALIVWASSFYTLHPGDVIFTGTPDGVGPVVPGDVISATIAGIGTMNVAVRAA